LLQKEKYLFLLLFKTREERDGYPITITYKKTFMQSAKGVIHQMHVNIPID